MRTVKSILIVLWAAIACISSAAPTNPRPGEGSRLRFLEVERIARLPGDQQAKEVAQLYGDLSPQLMSPIIEGILSSCPANILDHNAGFASPGGNQTERWAAQLADAAAKLTPGEVADKLDGRMWYDIAARARCIQTLRQHVDVLKPLVRADLESAVPNRVSRAAGVIHTLRLEDFLDTIVAIYLRNDECSAAAQGALVWYPNPDPRVAKALLADVAKTPAAITRHGGLLNGMLSGEPADPVVVKLLAAPEVEIRRAAAWAVSDCKDDSLAPNVAILVKDPDAQTRIAAARIARCLSDEAFRSVGDEVRSLLAASETAVRIQACACLAARKDVSAAPTLLDFLKLDKIEPGDAVGVMQALAKLTGSTFNYDMQAWGPGSVRNQQAIAQFEAWISVRRSILVCAA